MASYPSRMAKEQSGFSHANDASAITRSTSDLGRTVGSNGSGSPTTNSWTTVSTAMSYSYLSHRLRAEIAIMRDW